MSQWDIVTTLVTLAGFAAVVLPPVVRLNAAIARLSLTVEMLAARLEKLEDGNRKAHEKLHGRLDSQAKQLHAQELRLAPKNPPQ